MIDMKILNFGVDSLWMNFSYAQLDDETKPDKRPCAVEVLEKLEAYQELAKESDELVFTEYEFNGAKLAMYPHGGGRRSPWRYLLRSDDLEVKIGTGKKTGYVAKARVMASYLWSLKDLEQVIAEAHVFVSSIFGVMLYPQLSEVHPCADVAYDFGQANWQDGFIRRCGLTPHIDQEMHFVTPQEEESEACLVGPDKVHMRYRPITGYSFGTHASALSAVIYNKSAYIRTKEKASDYFHKIWLDNGWDGKTEVWRVEFRFKRDVLRDFKVDGVFHGIDYAYDLPDRLEAMWTYASIHWLRYVIPSDDMNRTRWQTHPVWELLQHAYFPLVRVDLGPMIRERKRVVNQERMVAQIVGCAMTLHAWDKNDVPCEDEDLSIVLHKLYPSGLDYLESRGKDFNTVVRKKQLLYNLIAA